MRGSFEVERAHQDLHTSRNAGVFFLRWVILINQENDVPLFEIPLLETLHRTD